MDYRTRTTGPVTVRDSAGHVVPSRRVDEVRGEPAADGKRRWTFALEFFAACPPGARASYTATFEDNPASFVADPAWEARKQGGVCAAVELEWPYATPDDDRHRPPV